jgi:2-amino-4-hydroxy-6-hydroxymethyldihydropteridine diphosphokinase
VNDSGSYSDCDRQLAYIGIGSNLEDPIQQVGRAFERLASVPDSQLLGQSSLYRSAPFGPVEQPEFVNAVALLATSLSAFDLLEQLQNIECLQGRTPGGVRWGPRVIDLDLLLYGDEEVESAKLTIPHPGIAERNFVLLPLRELSPNLMIPKLGPVSDIAVSASEPGISRIND